MTKDQKNQAIEVLKEKFSQYNNFYITNTESLTVEQVSKLRRACFDKNVELKVAKNTLIRKALESIDAEKYAGVYESLNGVTALMFSESAKEPALILSSFRKTSNGTLPALKAAYIDTDIFVGDDKLDALKSIKSHQDLIGDIISGLQSAGSTLAGIIKTLSEKEGEEVATAE